MRRFLFASLSLAALVASASAQNVIDRFPYPNGTKIPLWTTEAGSWKIQSQRLVYTGGSSWGYISNNVVKSASDCVLDIELIYPSTKNLYFGGVTGLMKGGKNTTGLLMTKLQDNAGGGTGAFNRIFMYERPGSSISLAVSPPTKRAVLRMFKKGNQAWFELDGDMNGSFEFQSSIKTLSSTTNKSGLVGANGYNAVELDNWKYYEGLLVPDKSTSPKIGSTFKMDFFAPLNGGASQLPTPWLGMMALGNAGIPVGGGQMIPLSLDFLFVNSLGFGWSGVLLKTKPSATLALRIPNDKGLVGLKLYAAAITLGAPRPGGIGAISNPHQFTVQ